MRNLLALGAGEVVAYDPRGDRRREVAERLGVTTVGTLGEAWAAGAEVALIAAPTRFHGELALEAARRGSHLFIEKPLSDRLAGVEPLLEAAGERRLVTLVGCNLRFHPGLRALKRLVEEEAVGRVVAVRAEVGHYLPDWHPWEDYRRGYSARRELGGGVILDAIHEIDYVRWLLGEVESVACFAAKLSRLDIDTEDTAALLLRFAGGAFGEIHLDYVQRPPRRGCQVIGDEGTIEWDFARGETRWYSARTGTWRTFSVPRGWEPNDMYVDELRHFLACLAGGERPALDLWEAARVLRVALAAKRSERTGRAVAPTSVGEEEP
jgi:predicted dehydrogenase